MDKFGFMSMVDDILEECKSSEELSNRVREMKRIINQAYVVKLRYKTTMGEFETKK